MMEILNKAKGLFSKYILVKRNLVAIFLGLFILIVLIPKLGITKKSLQNQLPAGTQQWIACNDFRDLFEEENKIYVACTGGVMVIDKSTGKILDQITMSNGLYKIYIESIAKIKDDLYIGWNSWGNFGKFNLKTRQFQMINLSAWGDANNLILIDNNKLWAGKSNNLKELKLNYSDRKAFLKELQKSKPKILITDKAIYIIKGDILLRWDLAKNKWAKFDLGFIQENNPQGANFELELVKTGNFILLRYKNILWQREDAEEANWIKVEMPAEITGKTIDLIIGGEKETTIISQQEIISRYNPATKQFRSIYNPELDSNQNIADFLRLISQSGRPLSLYNKGNKIWKQKIYESIHQPFLSWLNVDTMELTSVDSINWPTYMSPSVSRIKAVIDHEPILFTGIGNTGQYNKETGREEIVESNLWQYDRQNNQFKKVPKDFIGADIFQPIIGTSLIFFYSQGGITIGEGGPEGLFAEPQLWLYDYRDQTLRGIKIPPNILNTIYLKSINSYQETYEVFHRFIYEKIDDKNQEVKFTIMDSDQEVFFHISDESWSLSSTTSDDTSEQPAKKKFFCNRNYLSVTYRKIFKAMEECTPQLENDKYRLTYTEDKDFLDFFQEDKITGNKVRLGLSIDGKSFIPKYFTFANGKLWIGTDRGLAIYNLDSQSWKLMTVKEGLLNNEVLDFVVDKEKVWVITEGGLSSIPYR